jgi:serine/threonine protein phosphatase 1
MMRWFQQRPPAPAPEAAPARPPKTLVIGDIHGCYDELQALLDGVGLSSTDQIIHIGDLVDRGPAPQQVIEFFRKTPNALSLRGNRDDKHIQAYEGKIAYERSRAITRYHQFADDDCYAEMIGYLRTLPLYLELPEIILAHAYVMPGVPLAEQDPAVLMGHSDGEAALKRNGYGNGSTWYTHYDGEKPLAVGHRQYPFLHYQRKVYALDTRCVYGGTLTGLLLPDFVLYSVPARANYWELLVGRYPELEKE